MRFHTEVPLVAFLGLVHLEVSLAFGILGRARCSHDGGVDHRAGLEHQALLSQRGVDSGQRFRRELLLLQQVPKA